MNPQYQRYKITSSGAELDYGPSAATMRIAPSSHYGPPEGTATHQSWLSHALWLIEHPQGVAQPRINMSIEQAHTFARQYDPHKYVQLYGNH